ncbi:MAG: hypothetical protein IT210_22555 [Armatimonadetes bacterium]|nr:hypothetical protein [Armatimonadota bacterium]
MSIPESDRSILRRLAERQVEVAALPAQQETIREWKRLNARKPGRPLVWINEVPWHEMNCNDELTLRCADPFCRGVERQLRATLYQWEHFPGDMVVEPFFYSPLVIHDTGFGIGEDVRVIRMDPASGIVSREFHRQIREEKDLEKIKMPVLSLDSEATERNFHRLQDIIGDILAVQKCGVVHTWFAPWDELIRWWGVQDAMTDLVDRPELVRQAMDRLVNAYLARLEQWQAINALSLTAGDYRVGSGGLGYTDDIPQPDFNPERVRPCDQWGCATAQIFSDVSPRMHEEFALRYELRWLSRFGINYYGCCEPLHTKIDILSAVPNLRKISMSPRADVDKTVSRAGDRYALSHKPNPAVFATDTWNPAQARFALRTVLEKTRGCAVEVIMKDVSTIRYEPQRLWEWSRIATEEAARV